MLRFAFVLAALLVSPPAVSARTWHINPDGTGDAPTIQAGVDSAAVGDTVSLACGQYRETLIELTDGITLRGVDGPCRPQMFVGYPPEFVAGPYIRCVGVGSSTRIENLEFLQNASTTADRSAVSLRSSSATISNCVFTACWAESQNPGIRLDDSSPLIENCEFDSGCSAVLCESGSSPTIVGCTFLHCTRGIRLDGAGVVQVQNCTFRNCSGGDFGGGIYAFGSDALLVQDCMFHHGGGGRGAGMYVLQMPQVDVTATVFTHNYSDHGAIVAVASTVSIRSSLFHKNVARLGAAVYARSGAEVSIENTIFTDNLFGPTVSCFQAPPPTVTCSNMYGNEFGDWTGCLSGLDGIEGNFSAKPLFCDTDVSDYHLQWGSPCLPANSPDGCGLIGAFGFGGCNSVSVTPESWARVKARYR